MSNTNSEKWKVSEIGGVLFVVVVFLGAFGLCINDSCIAPSTKAGKYNQTDNSVRLYVYRIPEEKVKTMKIIIVYDKTVEMTYEKP